MDEDNKIRRNLVWFSAFIVGTQVIGVPVQGIVEHLAGLAPGSTHVSAVRLWVIVLVVLFYLQMRFWFADETKEMLNKFRTHWFSICDQRVNALIQADLERINRREPKLDQVDLSKTYADIDAKREYIRSRIEGMRGEAYEPEWVRVEYRYYHEAGTVWKGAVTAFISDRPASHEGVGEFTGLEIGSYSLSWPVKLWIRLVCAWKTIVWSRHSAEYLTPIGLWMLAVSVSLWSLGNAVLSGLTR